MPAPMNKSMDRLMAAKADGRVSFLSMAAETRAIMTRALIRGSKKKTGVFRGPFMVNSRMERL